MKEKTGQKLKENPSGQNIVFNKSENPTIAKIFAFPFETINLSDLLIF